jgi:hypothetical protein
MLVWELLLVVLLPVSLKGLRQLYLAGTFPINGSDGWQGGQVILNIYFKRQVPLREFEITFLSNNSTWHISVDVSISRGCLAN